MPRVLVVATSRKTRGGITSVVKAHETGSQWKKYHCHWVQTHRDGPSWRKKMYLVFAWVDFLIRVPFVDIVHIHGTSNSSGKRKLPFLKVAKLLNKKCIFHFHPANDTILFNTSSKSILKEIFSLSDLIIVLSPQWERLIKEAFPDSNYHLRVLWNPCPMVNRLSLHKKPQILYAGTLLKRKGYDVLLKAFSLIAYKHKEWSVVFAGNPYMLKGINELEDGKAIAERLNIEGQVQWLGWISGSRKDVVFNESSIYCLPSDGEGFPMGVLDAWAYGLPCVMTPVGGIPDIVEDGKNGLIFPIGDVNALAEKLDLLINNDQLRSSIVTESDKYVFGDFSTNVINSKLDDIYKSLL